jgi:hypothetical protein
MPAVKHSRELHAVWDTDLVKQVEASVAATDTTQTADQLEKEYETNPFSDSFSWQTGTANDLAWESHQLAEQAVYTRLNVPDEPCQVDLASCNDAPAEVNDLRVAIDTGYMREGARVVKLQLTKAGIRLAALLNTIWP